jgi:hypothetical protein
MVMNCPEGAGFQCAGTSIIRNDNGVALLSSGVQVYGRSTNDLANPIATPATATGFTTVTAPTGVADIRVTKDPNSTLVTNAMVLNNFGISWDNKAERPVIVETFRTAQGRAGLTATGALTSTNTLPPGTDLGFYNFANLGTGATQANYANNSYFPRAEPARCPAGAAPECQTGIETRPVERLAGNWRTGGTEPDYTRSSRLHNDGDIHSGNALPGSTPAWLAGGTGIGVPFPGSKGYRALDTWNMRYANIGAWITQDTVSMAEWTGGAGTDEHNTNRRGVTAFGQVTDPATVPTTGTATYTGIVYGWYSNNPALDPDPFRGAATITVDFATRQVTLVFQNTVRNDAAGAAVPASFQSRAAMGAAGTNVANYLSGPATSGSLTGTIGGRYFGPIANAGTATAGPAEIAGTMTLSNATSGVSIIGGFIGQKR